MGIKAKIAWGILGEKYEDIHQEIFICGVI